MSQGHQVALVTGASAGIGHAAVKQLLKCGFIVYAGARRVELMDDLAGKGARICRLDVADEASLVACVDQIVAECGRIDVLVNNAGYGSYGAIEDVPMAEARHQFEVNLFGAARLIQAVLPHMRARGRGRIINVGSIGGRITLPLGGWYHSSKFALEGLSGSLRQELRRHGVKVIVIQPGAIRTEWGGITAVNLRQASGSGAYGEDARALAHALALSDKVPLGSRPRAIGRVIARAATTRCPRPFYATGAGAKPSVIAARLLPVLILDLGGIALLALARLVARRK